MDSKPPAKNPCHNIVNLVAQRDEERRQEQQEQQTIDHTSQGLKIQIFVLSLSNFTYDCQNSTCDILVDILL
jgi:hypothetical protein